jgi:hypothetical protein
MSDLRQGFCILVPEASLQEVWARGVLQLFSASDHDSTAVHRASSRGSGFGHRIWAT